MSTRRPPNGVSLTSGITFPVDKERYEREQKLLESHSATLKRPKKCLSAYMIFVKEVSILVFKPR